MFSKSAKYYDALYASMNKDYAGEAEKVRKFVKRHKKSSGNKLLDVACGTGMHAQILNEHFRVEGLDLDSKLLSVARKKHPSVRFHSGDMVDFDLDCQFDVITCLFSSIGYVCTRTRLRKAIKNMTRHLFPGGVLLVEPWFSKEQWNVGSIHLLSVNRHDLKIVRMSRGSRRGNVSILEFQYLIGSSGKVEHQVEIHKLGLFSEQDYLDAFKSAGLKVIHDAKGLDGRGLYIGIRPLES